MLSTTKRINALQAAVCRRRNDSRYKTGDDGYNFRQPSATAVNSRVTTRSCVKEQFYRSNRQVRKSTCTRNCELYRRAALAAERTDSMSTCCAAANSSLSLDHKPSRSRNAIFRHALPVDSMRKRGYSTTTETRCVSRSFYRRILARHKRYRNFELVGRCSASSGKITIF